MRTAVVLPAPFGPRTPSTVPAGTSRSMPSRARTFPKDFASPRTRMAAEFSLCVVMRGTVRVFQVRFCPQSVGTLRPMGQGSTSSRLLALLALLQTRRDWRGPELAARLAVSERTVRRDVERLRDLGYPVDSLTGPAGGYRLQAGTAMPPLLLDDEEAVAIAVGLRTAAGAGVAGIEETAVRAMVKLEQVLPAHLRSRIQAVGTATSTLPPSGPTVDPEVLTAVAAACRDHQPLRFDYRDRRGTDARRDVEPHAVGHVGHRWYLLAWDRRRDDWRTFRLDRMARPWAGGTAFAPRPIPGGDAAGYIAASRSATPRHEAEVILHISAGDLTARREVWGDVEPIDERRCRMRTWDHDLDWLALRIAMLGVDFEVQSPPELVAHIAALGERFRRAGRADPDTPLDVTPGRA